jgi:hypothetical protein
MTRLFLKYLIKQKFSLGKSKIYKLALGSKKFLPVENSYLAGEEECADSESQNWEVFTGGSWQADPTAKVGPTNSLLSAKSKHPKNCRQLT